jgi:hypothetical protein
VQEREPIDEVNQIEDRLVFTRSSLVFGSENAVNDEIASRDLCKSTELSGVC